MDQASLDDLSRNPIQAWDLPMSESENSQKCELPDYLLSPGGADLGIDSASMDYTVMPLRLPDNSATELAGRMLEGEKESVHLAQVCTEVGSIPGDFGPVVLGYGRWISHREVLGTGRNGTVFRGFDCVLQREVAIKINHGNIPFQYASYEAQRLKNILNASPLLTPFLPALYGAFALENSGVNAFWPGAADIEGNHGRFCMVMERLAPDLTWYMKSEAPLGVTETGMVAQRLFEAISHLHTYAKVVHCDLKPDNVSFDRLTGRVALLDIGGGKEIRFLASLQNQPMQAGSYRAPEVFIGAPVTKAIDIFSIGCLLYWLALGSTCFRGNSDAELVALHYVRKGPYPKGLLDSATAETRDQYFRFQENSYVLTGEAESAYNRFKENPRTFFSIKSQGFLWNNAPAAYRLKFPHNQTILTSLDGLIRRCLRFSPAGRVSAKKALDHRFFRELRERSSASTGVSPQTSKE